MCYKIIVLEVKFNLESTNLDLFQRRIDHSVIVMDKPQSSL